MDGTVRDPVGTVMSRRRRRSSGRARQWAAAPAAAPDTLLPQNGFWLTATGERASGFTYTCSPLVRPLDGARSNPYTRRRALIATRQSHPPAATAAAHPPPRRRRFNIICITVLKPRECVCGFSAPSPLPCALLSFPFRFVVRHHLSPLYYYYY